MATPSRSGPLHSGTRALYTTSKGSGRGDRIQAETGVTRSHRKAVPDEAKPQPAAGDENMRVKAITQTKDGNKHEHFGTCDVSSTRALERAMQSFADLRKDIGMLEVSQCQSTNAFGLSWKKNHTLLSIEFVEELPDGFRVTRHGTVKL